MHENADLAGMRRADVEHVKAFASRQVDIARPAYGRVKERRPRRSIEWGSTNNTEYLQSQVGNRRFWPLSTGFIDVAALQRDRLQLLGEAATYEAQDESLLLDSDLWPAVGEEQEKRRTKDPWEDILLDIPENIGGTNFGTKIIHRGEGKEKVKSSDLLVHLLLIPLAQQTSHHSMRLALAMKANKWQRNSHGKVTIDGRSVRGYFRPDPADPYQDERSS